MEQLGCFHRFTPKLMDGEQNLPLVVGQCSNGQVIAKRSLMRSTVTSAEEWEMIPI
jgi:hypothetical protein